MAQYRFTVKLEGLSTHAETLRCLIKVRDGVIAVYKPNSDMLSDRISMQGLIRLFPANRTIVELVEEDQP